MPLRIIWRNGWVTGNRTAYDFLGPRYCPKAYSLQVFFFINENKVLGIVPKKLQAHIAIENISCERVLCRGIWTSTLKMPRFKTLDISSLTKIKILPNKFVLSKSKSTMSSTITCTCNPHETGKKVVSKVRNRLCHSYRKAGRSILASDWSTYFRLLSLAVGCNTW